MSEPRFATHAVHRVIARDDLLTMAAAADEAVSIVGQQVSLAKRTKDDSSLFVIALERYLHSAHGDRLWSVRAQAWDSAAIIVRFGEMVGLRPECEYTPEQMHAKALLELAVNDGSRLDKDLALGVFGRYHAARNLRIIGRYDEAQPLVNRPRTDLYGTGAEPHVAHYLFERGAIALAQGQAGQITDVLREWDEYWERTRAQGYSTRYRFNYIRALAYWELGADRDQTMAEIDAALNHIRDGSPVPVLGATGELQHSAEDHGVRELSVALAKAEFLADGAVTGAERDEVVALGRWALDIANRVRGRMRVVARSRAPLAAAFRRVYGDIALLADRVSGPAAAELGLLVSLSAKQTGFAARIRAERGLMNEYVRGVLDEIVEIESKSDSDPDYATTPAQRAERLAALHFKLHEKVSSMLADTVLPPPPALDKLTDVLGDRYALDYVELPHSLSERPAMYRALVRPNHVLFERFEPDPRVAAFFTARRESRDLSAGVSRDASVRKPDRGDQVPRPSWSAMASVLPDALLAELRPERDTPVPLLISAHSWLSLVPWAALTVDPAGIRLVQRALITQTPVLTCLTSCGPSTVDGRALVRLVGGDQPHGHGVDVVEERKAWGFDAGPHSVPLCAGETRSDVVPEPLQNPRLADALEKGAEWGFLHVASHGGPGVEEEAGGGHDGLRQVLHIPEQPVTAARALSLHWPAAVLMASCHVGQVVNARDAEPLNFVMALLTGGARCVVAGIAAIHDQETGRVASHIVHAIRHEGQSLDVALREAQLDAICREADEAGWALLAAYVR